MTGTDSSAGVAFRGVFAHSFTYLDGFSRNVHRYGDSAAMILPETGRIWTYRELDAEANRVARALAAAGVGAGARIVVMLPNVPEFAFLYLGAKKLGAIAAPINYRLAHGEIAYILDRHAPAAFVYDAEYRPTAERALAASVHRPALTIVVGEAGAGGYAAFVAPHGREPFVPEGELPGAYDETLRLFTSGTTGMPKGVPLTNVNEVLSAHDVIMQFPLAPEDATMNMTPWFHRGGIHSGGPCPAFFAGARVLPLRQFEPDEVLDHVERYRIAYLIGAPTNLAMLLDAQLRRRRDLSALKGIVTMGAPLARDACIRYQRELCERIFNGYGTTEAFWNTLLRPPDLPAHAGSAGRACIDDDVRVVRLYEDRRAAADDLAARDGSEVGEVIVRSPGKCPFAYVDDPVAEREVFRDGWVYIGDLATWDAQEYVTIVGRRDDMIISGGENVHPVQVEEALNEHPGVQDALVTGAPDERWGELVVAYVVRRDETLTAAELERYCSTHPMLARYKRPRAYRFLDALPLTATGKKRHFVMKAQAREDIAAGIFERV